MVSAKKLSLSVTNVIKNLNINLPSPDIDPRVILKAAADWICLDPVNPNNLDISLHNG